MKTIELLLLITILLQVSYLTWNTQRSRKRVARNIMYVDTSVLMDGRIVQIAESGFLTDTVIIPKSVITEMQLLADKADGEKRARARAGLDVAKQLQSIDKTIVSVLQDNKPADREVDEQLLYLARNNGGKVCTIDYNLNKVAQVEGIAVLNVNELAKNLRMHYLPGETMNVKLLQKGQEGHQAVAHASDGTMIVVENASSKIGKSVDIELIRSIQTDAGRMLFARLLMNTKNDTAGKDKAAKPKGRVKTAAATLIKKTEKSVKSNNRNTTHEKSQGVNENTHENRKRSFNKKTHTFKESKSQPSRESRPTKEDDIISLANKE